jgi:hypothetical protein
MDSRIVDDKIEVRNVVAVQPGWLLPRFVADWAKGEYYFNREPIIAWGTTVISGKTSRHKEQRALEEPRHTSNHGRAQSRRFPWPLGSEACLTGTFKIPGQAAPENEAAALP